MALAPFSLDAGRIRIGDAVLVYLERALAPPGPLSPGTVPRPHGIADTAVTADRTVIAAVGPGEAIWLGFQAVDRERPVRLRVRVGGTPPIDAVTGAPWQDGTDPAQRDDLVCPPDCHLVGVLGPAGRRAFGTQDPATRTGIVEELAVIAWVPDPAEVAVLLVRPERFTELTGAPAGPIDTSSAYEGWLLP